MNNPRHLSILDYTYILPEHCIAHYPLSERDASRLLIYKEGNISEDIYRRIANHLPPSSLLVFNDTKVIEARLLFQKSTGGIIEIFCLEPHEKYPDITTAMSQTGSVEWNCLVGGASKWKHGQVLEKRVNNITMHANYIAKASGKFVIALHWTPTHLSFAEALHRTGAIPLPPYIKREVEENDKDRYQTVYAGTDGSVAAPTAGLHFTQHIFHQLREKNIDTDFLTLHVGAGTFKPVTAGNMEEHEMHAEWIDVSKTAIENLLTKIDSTIIAVGTTSLRTMESLYWLGVKRLVADSEYELENTALTQWEAYELEKEQVTVTTALKALLQWMTNHKMERLVTKTQILIAPGYNFKIINGLITNFHQPQSTLLLLVAALIGEDWRKVYDHALENNFRFLSYGDGCLLWRK
jgi:S-adenosylmethionine:tRNA ribosyltransferase-isomerase